MKTNIDLLLKMLQHKRPSGDGQTKRFAKQYLEPVFGEPDAHGNYTLTISYPDGSDSGVLFTAHYDTVHSHGGYQRVVVEGDFATSHGNDCLGADCTTGIWLILGMIEADVPGTYVIHADEEIGCVGSRKFVADNLSDLEYYNACISFDRKGYSSIVTYQMGNRCASDEFASSLSDILGLDMKADDTGVFTDSAEYVNVVPECTNISVGYFAQHTKAESQDLVFAQRLLDALIAADWDRLVIARDPDKIPSHDNSAASIKDIKDTLDQFNNDEIATALFDMGIDLHDLYDNLLCAADYMDYLSSKG